jgi:hypothetical protein
MTGNAGMDGMRLGTVAGRSLLLLSFSLFWGGLTSYTGFVVRISHDVLNDPMDGGMITQRVTEVLQMLGAITVVLMLWNAFMVSRSSKRFGAALATCALVVGCAIVGLEIAHGHLDAVINVDTAEITNREVFTISHRRYNQLTTIEWLASLAYLPITVAAWRQMDEN